MAPGSCSRPGLGAQLKVPNTFSPHLRKSIWEQGCKGLPQSLGRESPEKLYSRPIWVFFNHHFPWHLSLDPGPRSRLETCQRSRSNPMSSPTSRSRSEVQIQYPDPTLDLGPGPRSRSKANIQGYRSSSRFRTNPQPSSSFNTQDQVQVNVQGLGSKSRSNF